MKYLIRSIKYFFFFGIVFFLMVLILSLTTQGVSLSQMFDPEMGMFKANSLPKIIILFGAVAAIYPALGFVKKEAFIDGTFAENREKIFEVFDNAGFILDSEDSEIITFRIKKPILRAMRMFEDKVSVSKDESPLILNGLRKEVYRLASAIEYKCHTPEEN